MAAEAQVVFLSFYGEDVPDDVVSYLTSSLKRSGIRVLQHDNEGSEDRRSVLNKIRESSFVLVILSIGFARSGQCLDELTMVKKRMNIGKLRPILIYYKLKQEDVNDRQSFFGMMLHRLETEEHKTSMRNGMDALLRTEVRHRNWREALVYVTATNGLYYHENDDFIKEITEQLKTASARDDEAIKKLVPTSQIKERTLSLLRSMGLQVDENISEDSYDKLSEELKKQLNKLILEATKKEGDISIPVYEKSPMAHTQIFINFRGLDVRRGFLSYLLDGLSRDGIKAYNDIDLPRGSSLFEAISQVIKEAGIALVIFSENYAESEWCLHELMVIKRNMDEGMLIVIPIFYNVKVHDVRRLRGKFGDQFRRLEKLHDEATVLAWREALQSVVQRMGIVYDSETSSESEMDFVMKIIEVVKQLLGNVSSTRR